MAIYRIIIGIIVTISSGLGGLYVYNTNYKNNTEDIIDSQTTLSPSNYTYTNKSYMKYITDPQAIHNSSNYTFNDTFTESLNMNQTINNISRFDKRLSNDTLGNTSYLYKDIKKANNVTCTIICNHKK